MKRKQKLFSAGKRLRCSYEFGESKIDGFLLKMRRQIKNMNWIESIRPFGSNFSLQARSVSINLTIDFVILLSW